jgi:hypothetical protein
VEVVTFTAVAVVLYLAAIKALDVIEVRRGARLANRNIIFFVILLSMALISFTILERVLGGA